MATVRSEPAKPSAIWGMSVQVLTARVAELEAKLGVPPKTPDNSSVPPSQGKNCLLYTSDAADE